MKDKRRKKTPVLSFGITKMGNWIQKGLEENNRDSASK